MNKKSVKKNKDFYPAALTVAGSDSGGGAGIQADLRTFNAFGVFGTSAITAVTAQNPRQISRIDALSGAAVTAQIEAVLSTFAVKCCKSGMLFSAENVLALAAAIKKYQLPLVCDPVMVATSGSKLTGEEAVAAAESELLPLATWITPNLPEAELLLKHPIKNPGAMIDSARELHEKFGASIILKGGHAISAAGGVKKAADIICHQNRVYRISSLSADFPAGTSHGTGCTLSSALCALLAVKAPWKEAVCAAKAFVLGALLENVNVGNGIYAMYPPEMNYMESVTLEELE